MRRQRRKALVPFIMGGDPDLATTRELLLALEDAGADLIEVGIPFSDPLADGPTIQAASARALAHGTAPAQVLSAIAAVRARLQVPVVCLSYWNPIVQFDSFDSGGRLRHRGRSGLRSARWGKTGAPRDGVRAFLRAARDSGCTGLIVPDLPIEEGLAVRGPASREGMATIFLAAPTSGPDRLRAIARASEGFIYYVSVTGTTGARRALPRTLLHGVRQLRILTTKPICVGFGISTPAQAAAVARIADGVIVGSALIQAMQESRGRQALRAATAFLKRLRRAV